MLTYDTCMPTYIYMFRGRFRSEIIVFRLMEVVHKRVK